MTDLHSLDRGVLPVLPIGHEVDVMHCLVLRSAGLVPRPPATQPLHGTHPLYTGHQQPQRVARFSGLSISPFMPQTTSVIQRVFHRNRARHARTFAAFREHIFACLRSGLQSSSNNDKHTAQNLQQEIIPWVYSALKVPPRCPIRARYWRHTR